MIHGDCDRLFIVRKLIRRSVPVGFFHSTTRLALSIGILERGFRMLQTVPDD